MELVIFIVGVWLGIYLTKTFMRPKYAGVLKSVKVEKDESPTFLLELDQSTDSLSNSDYVTFKVERIEL